MIVVKIELYSAVTGKVEEIGKMILANDGTSTNPKRGHYDVRLGRRGVEDLKAIWTKPQRGSTVRNHARLSFSVWVLVAKALKSLGIERFADFYEDETDAALAREGK